MKVIDLHPPPACPKSYRTKIFIIKKNFIIKKKKKLITEILFQIAHSGKTIYLPRKCSYESSIIALPVSRRRRGHRSNRANRPMGTSDSHTSTVSTMRSFLCIVLVERSVSNPFNSLNLLYIPVVSRLKFLK